MIQENVKISFYDLREAYYISWMQPIVQMRCRRNTTLRQRYMRTRNFKCSTRSNFESNFSSYKMWRCEVPNASANYSHIQNLKSELSEIFHVVIVRRISYGRSISSNDNVS